MNIEALEKLVALKEKGIISEAEFEIQKRKLLNNTPQPTAVYTAPINKVNKGINWANWFISLLFALVYYWIPGSFFDGLVGGFIDYFYYIEPSQVRDMLIGIVVNIILSIPLTIYAFKVQTWRYKGYYYCRRPGIIWLPMAALGPFIAWALFYHFLQIKQGNAVLIDKKA